MYSDKIFCALTVIVGVFFHQTATSNASIISLNANDRILSKSRNLEKLDEYKYETKWVEVPVDHFSFAIKDTFQLRYLINDSWRNGEKNAPIFFYTGNEGDIEVFAANTGFMWEIAPKYNAVVIFAEHRYYGQSQPFGNKSHENLGYLTSQQAIADYVDLIGHLRTSLPEMNRSPVIAFGGSYGGMLSAWIRMKYPHIVQGAIASSAPILQFTGVTDCEVFARIVTDDFKMAEPACPTLIRRSWEIINNITSTDEGKKWLSDTWKLCEPLKNQSHVESLKSFLADVYGSIAMVNYPYGTNFLAPLPGNPVKVLCGHLNDESLDGKPLLEKIHEAVSVYTNFTRTVQCLSVKDSTPNLGADLWYYQACTEMVMPMCTDGKQDMFEPEPWDFNKFSEECVQRYNIKPQANLACEQYGCSNLSTATNIIFSNGLLDPWSGGGVLQNLSSTAKAIIIPEAAHHLDLRSTNAKDPYSVTKARDFHRVAIRRWIDEHHGHHHHHDHHHRRDENTDVQSVLMV